MYKVGRTVDLDRRLSEYPRGARYLAHHGVLVDCLVSERRIIELFKAKYERSAKGLEYFRGNLADMLETFRSFCNDDPAPMQC